MTNKTLPISQIDLSDIDIKERHTVWKESISVVFDSVLKQEDQHKPFNASLTTCHLSSMLLSFASSGQQYFNRDRKLIAKDNLDHFLIQMYTQGSTSGQWGKNNNSTVRSGDIFLLDLNQPIKSLASDFNCLTLIVPRSMICAKLSEPERQHGRVLPRESILAKLLGEHLKTLYFSSQTLSEDEAGSVAEGVLSLVGSYFNHTLTDDNCQKVQSVNRESIRRYIINNLTDYNLTADSIALHFKISRAYLYRLFDTGQGIHQFILEQRLLKAFNQLNNPANHRLRISQIAYDLGFNSESHFSRSFHRAFGMTPSNVRHSVRINHRQEQDNAHIDRHFEKWIVNLR
jgi:AraC-like DNA-binding protein